MLRSELGGCPSATQIGVNLQGFAGAEGDDRAPDPAAHVSAEIHWATGSAPCFNARIDWRTSFCKGRDRLCGGIGVTYRVSPGMLCLARAEASHWRTYSPRPGRKNSPPSEFPAQGKTRKRRRADKAP